MLYSDIETGDARHKHFSDREAAGSAPAGGPPLPPSGPELPHAGLGLAQPPAGMGMGFGVGSTPGLGLGAAPVDDGSFAGGRVGRQLVVLGLAVPYSAMLMCPIMGSSAGSKHCR